MNGTVCDKSSKSSSVGVIVRRLSIFSIIRGKDDDLEQVSEKSPLLTNQGQPIDWYATIDHVYRLRVFTCAHAHFGL